MQLPVGVEQLQRIGLGLSKSRGTAVEVPYFLSKYDPDPLRFYLTATAPETSDTDACPERSRGVEGMVEWHAILVPGDEAQSSHTEEDKGVPDLFILVPEDIKW